MIRETEFNFIGRVWVPQYQILYQDSSVSLRVLTNQTWTLNAWRNTNQIKDWVDLAGKLLKRELLIWEKNAWVVYNRDVNTFTTFQKPLTSLKLQRVFGVLDSSGNNQYMYNNQQNETQRDFFGWFGYWQIQQRYSTPNAMHSSFRSGCFLNREMEGVWCSQT
jgi:hypothetical protein